jgi:hypothetical protein
MAFPDALPSPDVKFCCLVACRATLSTMPALDKRWSVKGAEGEDGEDDDHHNVQAVVSSNRISRIAADEEEDYAAKLELHIQRLQVPAAERELAKHLDMDSEDTPPNRVTATSSGASTTEDLVALARSCRAECSCFQPSAHTNDGEPSCRHAELLVTSVLWTRELVAVLQAERSEWNLNVAAPWRVLVGRIASEGTARERFRRDWDNERVRAVVELQHREAVAGRQLEWAPGAPSAAAPPAIL